MVCIRDELMLTTTRGHVLQYRWDSSQNRDYCLELRRVPFCIDQQVSKGTMNGNLFIYLYPNKYSFSSRFSMSILKVIGTIYTGC